MSEIQESSSPSNVTGLLQEIDILSIDFNKENNHDSGDEDQLNSYHEEDREQENAGETSEPQSELEF